MAKRKKPDQSGTIGWDEIESALLEPIKRGARKSPARQTIEDLFDENEQRELRRLAERARLVRSRSPALGNVIFLHGITGSDLAVTDPSGDADNIWVHVPRLLLGRLEDLRLDADGKTEAKAGFTVRPTSLNKKYYAKAILALRARWNVKPFAYDWRKDIDEASEGLATLIRSQFPGRPVHLVAHSMGGLVARNFIRQHPQLWETMRDPDLLAGGRLVMLGTPNYGAYAIPPVLTGTDQLMELLERIDLRHNMPNLLRITNSFLGSYMLLPSPSKLPSELSGLYQKDMWGNVPGLSQAHLNRTYQFYKDLEGSATIDPGRMVYIAGCRVVTIDSMRIVSPGEFEYQLGYRGDGRVPHELGLLPGVPTYYVDEVHGDLARNERVLRAVDSILESGETRELGTTVLRTRGRGKPRMRDYRTAAERLLMEELERIGTKARAQGGPEALTRAEERVAADALVKAALGANAKSLPTPLRSDEGGDYPAKGVKQIQPVDLEVRVQFGDVTEIKAPVVIVGHYRGVPPVNAIGAIDQALGGWITRAVARGMISGHLGETFYVPTKGAIAADGAVVAGMGDYGQFSSNSLRQLMANVAVGAAALGFPSIASVLVGAGDGAIDRDTALRELLEGLGTGLIELRDEKATGKVELRRLSLIEHNPMRYFALGERLRTMATDSSLATVNLKVLRARPEDDRRARSAESKARNRTMTRRSPPRNAESRSYDEVRITVERDAKEEAFRFSALTRSAVVPVREVRVDFRNAFDAADALRNARTRDEQERYGRLLYTYLMPEDFQDLMEGPYPIRLIVDPSTAALPWEMACFIGRGTARKLNWLGTDLGLTRQFKTLLSSAPGVSPSLNDSIRALVIADPAPERELQLPGARKEGRRLVELLQSKSGTNANGSQIHIEVESRIGAGECDPVEMLALLLSGDFDIVHFSGHGDYNFKDPKQSGWIFGADRILSARDIFRAREVPRLVFANACFSGALRETDAYGPIEQARSLASIAEAFLERGVPNYVGTGWPVDDSQAVTMAEAFYGSLLQRRELGEALKEGRQEVFKQGIESTWGAYQLYGNPRDSLLRREDAGKRS